MFFHVIDLHLACPMLFSTRFLHMDRVQTNERWFQHLICIKNIKSVLQIPFFVAFPKSIICSIGLAMLWSKFLWDSVCANFFSTTTSSLPLSALQKMPDIQALLFIVQSLGFLSIPLYLVLSPNEWNWSLSIWCIYSILLWDRLIARWQWCFPLPSSSCVQIVACICYHYDSLRSKVLD